MKTKQNLKKRVKNIKTESLLDYYMLKGLYFRKNYKIMPFHEKIINAIENMVFEKTTKNLAICIPPRFGKTHLIMSAIEWSLGLYPDSNYIWTSYASSLVNKYTKEMRDTIASDFHANYFGRNIFDNNSTLQVDNFTTRYGGMVKGVGVSGTITGLGAGINSDGWGGCIVIDDPLNATDATSDTVRTSVNDWYTGTLMSRKNKEDTPIIMIAQRLHMQDLVGYIKEIEPENWIFIEEQALVNEKSIWEKRKSTKSLIKLRNVDAFTFNAQYQQKPIIDGGNLIKTEWLKYYENIDMLPPMKFVYTTSDTAMTEKTTGDYSVLLTMGVDENNKRYVLGLERGRWNAPQLLDRAVITYNHYNAKYTGVYRGMYIEQKVSGFGLIDNLRALGIPTVAITPQHKIFGKLVTGDKVNRANVVMPMIESGIVLLPKKAQWTLPLVEEIGAFPNGEYDDQVDAFVYALILSMF